MTRGKKTDLSHAKQAVSPIDNTKRTVEAVRDLFYTGEKRPGEDAYILFPAPRYGYSANMWYEHGNGEDSFVIVRTQFGPTAISLLHATSIAYHHFRLSIDPPVLNVNLPQSDVILVNGKKYFWCDMNNLVVVVPYTDPVGVIPAIDDGIWKNRTVVLIDEEKHFWRGGKWEDCYWFVREEIAETPITGGTIETIQLPQSKMKYTRDAYKWYKALLRIKQAFSFLLAFLPLALFETEDNEFVVELATHTQEQRLRAIVPSYTD